MTRLKYRPEKLGRQTWAETSGPRTTEREEITRWKGSPELMTVSEKARIVSSWPLEKCKSTIREIKTIRGNNQRAWPDGTAETYGVVMRRIQVLTYAADGNDPRWGSGVVSEGGW